MKTNILLKGIGLLLFFIFSLNNIHAQNLTENKKHQSPRKQVDNYITSLLRDELNRQPHHSKINQVCDDTVYSIPHSKLYFCFGGKCVPESKLYFQINGSHGAGATADSAIVWLMTDDKDGAGPRTSLPDSLVPGHNIHNSSNRARWIGGITPAYISDNPGTWISPYSFQYIIPSFWADSGRSMCFTPIAWDSTHAGQLFEKDNCFGYGQPIQKIIMRAIYTEHFFSCDSGQNNLHLITKGGLPQYNHFNGYGNSSEYVVTVNSNSYNSHYADTLIIPAEDLNAIIISDSLGNSMAADGCVIYEDTILLYPSITIENLSLSTFDNSPDDTFNVSPVPSGAMQIDFLTSDPASDGIHLINVNGDTIFSQYPIGISVGPGNTADQPGSLFIYDIPLTNQPYRVVATNDAGSGWQDSTCFSLPNNGHLKIFDLATGDSLSTTLYPMGDSLCGASGNWVVDTFGVYTLAQYNKTQLSINSSPSALSGVDNSGHAIFSPSTAGPGTYEIKLSYNDTKSNLCDKDTTITVIVNSFVGIYDLKNNSDVSINNPVHDLLTITQKSFSINYVELLDVTGKMILRSQLMKDQPVDLSAIAQGVYFLKLYDKHYSLIDTKKIIRE